MYQLIRALFWLLSLLPFWFFHALSRLTAFILHKVVRYRWNVIMQNLSTAFPEQSLAWREQVARQFYLNLTDTFLETIKLLSLSSKRAFRRVEVDVTLVNQLLAQGRNVQLMVAHQFNWEFINLTLPVALNGPFYFVYRPIENKPIDHLYRWHRTRFGGIAVSADTFVQQRDHIFSHPSVLALGADQNPGRPGLSLWMPFFSKPVPFFTGPAKGAIQYNAALVLLQMQRTGRGRYRFTTRMLCEHPRTQSLEQLTWQYKNEVERMIREDPSNYLWSHRRWRHEWKPEFGLFTGA